MSRPESAGRSRDHSGGTVVLCHCRSDLDPRPYREETSAFSERTHGAVEVRLSREFPSDSGRSLGVCPGQRSRRHLWVVPLTSTGDPSPPDLVMDFPVFCTHLRNQN